MKTAHLIQLALAMVATVAIAEENPIFECLVAETKICVFMGESDFDPDDHVIERKPGSYGPETLYIDGEIPIGSDNQTPERALTRFEVFWDEEEVPIPPSLYKSHYHPNIDEKAIQNRLLVFTIDPRGQWIQIVMSGSDGGGAYLVGWELRRDGKHHQFDPSLLHRHPS